MDQSSLDGHRVSSEVREVLRAIRAFSDALDRMHSGMKYGMAMNASDIATLRMMIIREQRGESVSPHDVARHLRISTASTTKLIDRLEASGHIVRTAHPHDRRARVLQLTELSRRTFREHFSGSLAAMTSVAERYAPDELTLIADFLTRTASAIDPEA